MVRGEGADPDPPKRGGARDTTFAVLNGTFTGEDGAASGATGQSMYRPRSTLHGYLQTVDTTGDARKNPLCTLSKIDRRKKSRSGAKSHGLRIDSQRVKSAGKGGRIDPKGYDAGKRTAARHEAAYPGDTIGL